MVNKKDRKAEKMKKNGLGMAALYSRSLERNFKTKHNLLGYK